MPRFILKHIGSTGTLPLLLQRVQLVWFGWFLVSFRSDSIIWELYSSIFIFFKKNHKSKVVKCREIAAICREKLRNVKSIFSTPKSHGKK